ncbi:T9SS type A sorting domain-containing protein [Taibaiella koreensis]|uniref:T9SS type A sorting domain-containing protein n=1 Tax=Taibaiella koreensis TaxID=1268548 RepID=UPI0013C3287D|nr:T9SS type A sorting domain-containing protein [Taibaiella koreensis]
MKKIFHLIIVLLLLAGGRSYSQNQFAPVGAEWWYYSVHIEYQGEPRSQTNSTFHTQSIKDTLIDGIACRKVITDIRSDVLGGFHPNNRDYYFYDNTDTVFVYNENFNRFTPLFVYNAQEGDTICLPVPPTPGGPQSADLRPNPISGDTSFCFVLDSVRVLLYDTAHLRTYFIHALKAPGTPGIPPFSTTAYPSYNWGIAVGGSNDRFPGKYIERIAGDFLPSKIILNVADGYGAPYAPYDTLRCYSDSFYSLKLVPEACDTLYPVPLGIKDPKPARAVLQCYPNPAAGQLYLAFKALLKQEAVLSFSDISGRPVFRTTLPAGRPQTTIDVGRWSNGLYLLRLQTGAEVYYEKIAVGH